MSMHMLCSTCVSATSRDFSGAPEFSVVPSRPGGPLVSMFDEVHRDLVNTIKHLAQ